MITYVKRKHNILGVIRSSFWGIYTEAEHLRVRTLYNAYVIIHDNIVSFCIFSLLKYDRIFGKNLEHDTYGVK